MQIGKNKWGQKHTGNIRKSNFRNDFALITVFHPLLNAKIEYSLQK